MGDENVQGPESGEGMLRALLNAVTESILLVDPEGTVLTLNETAAERFGKTVEEMIGARMQYMGEHLLPSQTRVNRESKIREVVRTRQAVRFEDMRAGRHLDTSMYPVVDETGDVRRIAIFSKDVTESRRLQEELQASQEKYRAVVENAGEAIAIVDDQGVFLFMNGTAARALGGAPSDFTGKTMWELFPKEIADRQAEAVRKVVRTGSAYGSIAQSCVAGQRRWYGTTIAPLRDAEGRVTAGLLVARDVHDLMTAQKDLEAYREKMRRTEHLASLGTLSATFAHELTQPLTVIRLSVQNAIKAIEEGSPSATVLNDLADGVAEIAHVTAIIERFRRFARNTSDRQVGPVDLNEAARRVIRLLDEDARAAGITLIAEGIEDLPPIRANERDMDQVFFALTQNAIHAAQGLDKRRLRIVGEHCRGEVELRFDDDCGGIPPSHMARVFEPFFTTKQAAGGTGLGLCIVQRIVTQAGGHIRVDSRFGKGTTFIVTLPVEQ